ncbi:MAG: heparinase II/III family protein [Caulobacteraceae bacterium]
MARSPTLKIPDVSALKNRLRRLDLSRLRQFRLRLSGRRAERAGLYAAAIGKIVRDQLRAEWAGSAPHRWLIARPRPQGVAAAPTELRPARPRRGKSIAAGRFVFDGLVLEAGARLDPWNRPSPSRAFAEGLHGMDWLHDLLAVEDGAELSLHLLQGWMVTFGRWNAFAWSGLPLERRVRNLACALKPLLARADAQTTAAVLDSLARQARHLLLAGGPETRSAERAAAAALAGAVLDGPAGEALMDRGLRRLDKALPETVLPDGGHASRAPEAGLELLLDLKTLDEALAQRGRAAPEELTRAIDRLTAAVRRFTLPDGRLVALQGGEEADPARIAAALGEGPPPAELPLSAPHAGYEFLAGGQLLAVVDAGAPAPGAWSASACAQPLAVEVTAGGDRLIVASAWSSRAPSAQALRLTPAASTASVSDSSCGYPLQGWLAKVLGYRLEAAATEVRTRRHESEGASWLELSHDGWVRTFGLLHERRLFLDPDVDELRGEDQLVRRGTSRPNGRSARCSSPSASSCTRRSRPPWRWTTRASCCSRGTPRAAPAGGCATTPRR